MGKIAAIEYFRVPPRYVPRRHSLCHSNGFNKKTEIVWMTRWLFVKISDESGNIGWGEATLEGHTEAVEGCLDAYAAQYVGLEAE
jgi:galactonate dehydratase